MSDVNIDLWPPILDKHLVGYDVIVYKYFEKKPRGDVKIIHLYQLPFNLFDLMSRQVAILLKGYTIVNDDSRVALIRK